MNYTKEQLKKFKIDTKSDNNYILVYDDVGTLIFNIWKTSGTSTHSMDIKYVTDEKTESYTRLVDWNRVKSVRKLKFACPVDIGIYNGNGDLVTTLYEDVYKRQTRLSFLTSEPHVFLLRNRKALIR